MADRTRQYGTIDEIRSDHVKRYEFAVSRTKQHLQNRYGHAGKNCRVLDAACGCGYGTKIMEQLGRSVGVDIEQSAIDYAKTNYGGPGYLCSSILDKPWVGTFDVVTSFETIEHIAEPERALRLFRDSVDGLFFVSVPNELVMPFKGSDFSGDKYPHLRHYTPEELDAMLLAADFRVIGRKCQKYKRPGTIEDGTDGLFLVYVCT